MASLSLGEAMTTFTTQDREEAMKTRYCSSCISYRPADTGQVIQTSNKNIRRWVCANCLNKTSVPQLKSKGKE
jgi:hypothetical protein